MAGKTIAPPGSGSGSATEGVAAYLSDPAFQEPNKGPAVPDRWHKKRLRDPSPAQIRKRAAAIRKAYPREPQGLGRDQWTPPLAAAPDWFDPEALGKAV